MKNHLLIFGLFFSLLLEVIFLFLGVSWLKFPLFLVVFLLGSYVPGALFTHLLGLECGELERLTLELTAGYVLTTLVYFLASLIGLESLCFVFIALAVLVYLYLFYQQKVALPYLRLSRSGFDVLFIVCFLLLIAFSGWFSFSSWLPAERAFLEPGSLQLVGLNSRDDISHHGLINELSHTFPPNYHLAGSLKNLYHFFADLYASFFVRYLGFVPGDLTMRFQLLLHMTLWFLAVFLLARQLFKERWVGLLTVFLVGFTSNLGILSPLFSKQMLLYDELRFLPVLVARHAYSYQIGYPLIFLGFFALLKFEETNKKSWFGLSAFLLLLCSCYKVYMLLAVFLGLVAVSLFCGWRKERIYLWVLTLILGLGGLLWLFIIRFYSPFEGSAVAVNPWFLVFISMYEQNSSYFGAMTQSYREYHRLMFASGGVNFLKYFVGYGLLFFGGSLGVRLFALKDWIGALARVSDFPASSVLAYVALAGVLFSSVLTLPPDHYNTANFMMLSVQILTFYASASIYRILLGQNRLMKALFLVLVVLSLSTMVELTTKRRVEYVPASLVRLANFFETGAERGAIVAHPLGVRNYYLIPALSRVRTMMDDTFPTEAMIGIENWTKLVKSNNELYQTRKMDDFQRLAKAEGVSYIIEDTGHKLKCNKNKTLLEVYNRDGFTVLKVPD